MSVSDVASLMRTTADVLLNVTCSAWARPLNAIAAVDVVASTVVLLTIWIRPAVVTRMFALSAALRAHRPHTPAGATDDATVISTVQESPVVGAHTKNANAASVLDDPLPLQAAARMCGFAETPVASSPTSSTVSPVNTSGTAAVLPAVLTWRTHSAPAVRAGRFTCQEYRWYPSMFHPVNDVHGWVPTLSVIVAAAVSSLASK